MRCLLCGLDSPDVRVALIRWRDPLPGKTFDQGPRCRDSHACWERVKALGEAWPVDDGREVDPKVAA
jgi:hypothetical protein